MLAEVGRTGRWEDLELRFSISGNRVRLAIPVWLAGKPGGKGHRRPFVVKSWMFHRCECIVFSRIVPIVSFWLALESDQYYYQHAQKGSTMDQYNRLLKSPLAQYSQKNSSQTMLEEDYHVNNHTQRRYRAIRSTSLVTHISNNSSSSIIQIDLTNQTTQGGERYSGSSSIVSIVSFGNVYEPLVSYQFWHP